MTDDGREPRTGDSVAPGRTVVAGRQKFPAAHLVVTAPRYRQRRGGTPPRPILREEVPMA